MRTRFDPFRAMILQPSDLLGGMRVLVDLAPALLGFTIESVICTPWNLPMVKGIKEFRIQLRAPFHDHQASVLGAVR